MAWARVRVLDDDAMSVVGSRWLGQGAWTQLRQEGGQGLGDADGAVVEGVLGGGIDAGVVVPEADGAVAGDEEVVSVAVVGEGEVVGWEGVLELVQFVVDFGHGEEVFDADAAGQGGLVLHGDEVVGIVQQAAVVEGEPGAEGVGQGELEAVL